MKQSIDWNDDINDDPGAAEDIPNIDNDGCEQASETKHDAANPVEENEWDKLLRLRCFTIPCRCTCYFTRLSIALMIFFFIFSCFT